MAKFSDEKVDRITALSAILAEKHPVAFPSPKPGNSSTVLKVGIHKDISALYPEVSRRTLSGFMSWHTRSPKYLGAASVAGTARYDLDGNIVGHVTEDQAKAAKAQLAERKAKRRAAKAATKQEGQTTS
ncbi:ProQ/FINO family protein [Agrobacterium salinitolerans]|nr:ProQ/FINO family protein [Agrobacterium salinitolerans]